MTASWGFLAAKAQAVRAMSRAFGVPIVLYSEARFDVWEELRRLGVLTKAEADKCRHAELMSSLPYVV